MTDQEKDHLVAASMGIVSVNTNGILYQTKDGLSHNCPPFGECLNAMHEAEKVIIQNNWKVALHTANRYMNEMCKILGCLDTALFQFAHATAAQRREAYLRTLNLLKE